jgi:hypothetical protein
MKSCQLQPKNSIKLLGITFDRNLTFEDHADMVGRKVTGFLRMLVSRRKLLPRNVIKLLVNAYVSSRLLYGLSIIGASAALRRRFQLLQNFAVRTIFGVPKFSRVSLLRGWLGWQTIDVLSRYRFGLLMYKSINGRSPPYLEIRLGDYASARQSTSRSGNLVPPVFTNNHGLNRFDIRCINFYNDLSDKSPWTSPLNEFKRKLLNWLASPGSAPD